jgi:hypothetical protein
MTSFGDPGRLSSALMMLAFGAAILFSVVRVAQTANHEYFFAKPYVQAETSDAAVSAAPSVLWHAADSDANWRVKYTTDGHEWHLARPVLLSRLNTELMTQHRVYRAELSNIAPGRRFRYEVFRNGAQVFSGGGRSPVAH